MLHAPRRPQRGRYTAAIVATLSIGIAGATVSFPVFVTAYFPSGWLRGGEIVSIMAELPALGVKTSVGGELLRKLRDGLDCCDPIGGLVIVDSVMRMETGARSVRTALIGTGILELAGTEVLLGRTFSPETAEAEESLVLVTRAFARAQLGGVSHALGKKITLDGKPVEVVGVISHDFGGTLRLEESIDVVRPVDTSELESVLVFSRLRKGVSPTQAQAELDALSRYATVAREGEPEERLVVVSSRELMETNTRRVLEVAIAGGSILVLVTMANISHLLAARSKEQRKQLAIRWAMGATRWTQTRWQARDVLTLTAYAGVGAALLAEFGERILALVFPKDFRCLITPEMKVGSLVFALGLCFAILFSCGALPILLRSHSQLTTDLRGDNRLGSHPRWIGPLGDLHVVTMVGAAVAVAVAAHLLLGSVLRLSRIDLGFDALDLQAVRVQVPREASPASRDAFFEAYTERLSMLPEVSALALASQPPPGSGIFVGDITLRDQAGEGPSLSGAAMTSVGPGYFRTLRQRILSGREFVEQDLGSSAPVLIVSETAAKYFGFDAASAVGQGVWLGEQRSTIIGVVTDVNAPELMRPFGALQLYRPLQSLGRASTVMVRSKLDLGSSPRAIANALDPDVVIETASVESLFWSSLSSLRFLTVLLTLLVLIVIGLAMTGVYGVFSSLAARQRGQFAVRLMLGARPEKVRRWMQLKSLRVSLAGVLLGLVASYPLSELLRGHLFGMAPESVLARVLAAALVLIVANAAVWLPAVRISRIDPGEILRGA